MMNDKDLKCRKWDTNNCGVFISIYRGFLSGELNISALLDDLVKLSSICCKRWETPEFIKEIWGVAFGWSACSEPVYLSSDM